MFLAGLQTIPLEHYEAARVDGAGPIQCLWHITLPGLRNVSIMLTLLITIWTFGRAFTIVFLLTEGGPAGCTENIVIRSYLEAFKFYHLGVASALGMIVLVISLAFSIAYLAIVNRRAELAVKIRSIKKMSLERGVLCRACLFNCGNHLAALLDGENIF